MSGTKKKTRKANARAATGGRAKAKPKRKESTNIMAAVAKFTMNDLARGAKREGYNPRSGGGMMGDLPGA